MVFLLGCFELKKPHASGSHQFLFHDGLFMEWLLAGRLHLISTNPVDSRILAL
jgi:hypothetical protein